MRSVAVAAGLALAGVIALAGASGCGGPGSPVGSLRFENQPVVWRVNDRFDVPGKPAERTYARVLYQLDGYVVRRLTRKMELPRPRRAQNVNALDEVPDSTWFTNRIGLYDVSPAELLGHPGDGPETHKPWTITGSKVGGLAVGFLMTDARGVKYLLKFDNKKGPELETAADVIVQRLLRACGYNVPDDNIVYFRREDLVLADDATNRDVFGNKSPMSVADLEAGLARVDVRPDGSYRGLASKYLPGIPIGPYAREGVRADDHNDVIPHQLRRELRGAYAIFEWLGHTDLQEDNTLDMWHEDPAGNRHYVMHYLLDFGKALGVMSALNRWKWPGFTHRIDFSYGLRSLVTLGLWKRPFDDITAPALPGVGLFEHENYQPGSWKANSPYWPLKDKDRFDALWGSKIIMRFTEDHVRAAVAAGRLSDPRSAEYLVDTLIARQRKTARYWFRRVNPLDRFTIAGARLCFDDLTARHRLEDVTGTGYRVATFDYHGRPTGFTARAAPGRDGRVCVDGIRPSQSPDGYLIARIETRRAGYRLPPTLVHLARANEDGPLGIIGLRRE